MTDSEIESDSEKRRSAGETQTTAEIIPDLPSVEARLGELTADFPDNHSLGAAAEYIRRSTIGDAQSGFNDLETGITLVEQAQTDGSAELQSALKPIWAALYQEKARRLPAHELAQSIAEHEAAMGPNPDQLSGRPPTASEAQAGSAAVLEAIRARLAAIDEAPGSLLPTNAGTALEGDQATEHTSELAEVIDFVKPDAAGLAGTQEVQGEASRRLYGVANQYFSHHPEAAKVPPSVVTVLGSDNLPEAAAVLAIRQGIISPADQLANMSYAEFAKLAGIVSPSGETGNLGSEEFPDQLAA